MKLIFLPDMKDEWTIVGYSAGIWNDSQEDMLYYIEMNVPGKTKIEKRGKIEHAGIKEFSYLEFEEINFEPSFNFQFWKVEHTRTELILENTTKLKAKRFFSKKATIPGTKIEGIIYDLQNNKKTIKKEGEDLNEYTLNNLAYFKEERAYDKIYASNKFDLNARVEFKNEIDLHIENLIEDYAKMQNKDKLQVQIKSAIEFLDKAFSLGINKVFIIHGIGKGKLKDEIKELLHKHPNVKRFKNEYHHKYGYGATEVDLR